MPSPERRKEIEAVVNQIINDNNLKMPGFDLVAFLTQKKSFKIGLKDLAPDTTGLLLVNESRYIGDTQTHRLIVVNRLLQNSPDYLRKRRFITAHEYGHFVLHNDGNAIFAHRDHTTREAPYEKEADFFARCLLMPKDLINDTLAIGGVKSSTIEDQVSFIARTFNVTEKKAYQRLVEDMVCHERYS